MISPFERRGTRHAVLAVTAVASIVLAGCSSQGTPRLTDDGATVATIAGTPVTVADLRERIGTQLDQLDNQYQQQRQGLLAQALEQVLQERLLDDEATRRGMTVDELISAEVTGKVAVTDQDVRTWYAQNQERVPGRTLEEVYPTVEALLRRGQQDQMRAALFARLQEEHQVEVLLQPFRIEFDNSDAPARGPASAPVTLVEFSDFECPFCARFYPTLARLEEHYGDKLRIVYRQFPLSSIHPRAVKAAEASLCAHDQGKFWEMHDLLFEQTDKLGLSDLKEAAGRLALDRAEFDACLDSGRHAERVERDFNEGRVAGVDGTPALFVNGVRVPGGAVPFETVVQAIDAELERVKRN